MRDETNCSKQFHHALRLLVVSVSFHGPAQETAAGLEDAVGVDVEGDEHLGDALRHRERTRTAKQRGPPAAQDRKKIHDKGGPLRHEA